MAFRGSSFSSAFIFLRFIKPSEYLLSAKLFFKELVLSILKAAGKRLLSADTNLLKGRFSGKERKQKMSTSYRPNSAK
jgi:hypothetical protein